MDQEPEQAFSGRRDTVPSTPVSALLIALLVGAIGITTHLGQRAGQPNQQHSAEVIVRATVFQKESHRPQMCLGPFVAYYPPRCDGPDLIGFDWADARAVIRDGVRWGDFVVVGLYDPDAQTLTLTRPPVPYEAYQGPSFEDDPGSQLAESSTPCDKPVGGWRVIDPAMTTQETMEQTWREAASRQDFGGSWLDQSINPAAEAFDAERDEATEQLMNDPTQLILNVAVTGDVTEAEWDLRKTWGGALCVSRSMHTDDSLIRIQDNLSATEHVLSAGVGDDVVEIGVVWDDGSLQARLDKRFGPGVVEVSSALKPFRSRGAHRATEPVRTDQ